MTSHFPKRDFSRNELLSEAYLSGTRTAIVMSIFKQKKMKKIVLIFAVVLVTGMVSSCTNQSADEKEFSELTLGIDGQDQSENDEEPTP